MTRIHFVPMVLALAACGGSSPSGPDGNTSGDFTAKIDNVAWSSPTAFHAAQGSSTPGTFVIIGGSGNATQPSLSLSMLCISGPGTYPLGVGGFIPGGLGTLSLSPNGWSTPLSGSAGTVQITAISSTRIAGKFSFVAAPAFGTSTSSRTVTDGNFDLPLTVPGSTTLPDNQCSTAGGTLGGAPWNASTVVTVAKPSSGTLAAGFSNDEYSLTLIVSGLSGTGSYAMNTGASRQATLSTLKGASRYWGGSGAASAGSVVITSLTASRVKGSYNITLQPGNGTSGNMTLIGTFDIGLQ